MKTELKESSKVTNVLFDPEAAGETIGYGLGGPGIVVQFPAKSRDFSLHRSVHIGCGANPDS
jgi:hypothetical protein